MRARESGGESRRRRREKVERRTMRPARVVRVFVRRGL